MTTDEAVLLAVVVFIILAGIWLAGLTYLMWRAHMLRRTPEEPPEGDAVSEEVKTA